MLCNEDAGQRRIRKVRDADTFTRNIAMVQKPKKNTSKATPGQLLDANEEAEGSASTQTDDVARSEKNEIQAWIHGPYAREMAHLRAQDECVTAILTEFEKGNRDEVRYLLSKHTNPGELFLFFLDHWLLDTREKAVNSAEMKHAPMKPYYKRARRQFSEEKAKNKRLTQEKLAENFFILMQRDFETNQIEIKECEKELATHVAIIEGVINTEKKILLKDEVKQMKDMLRLKKLHPKPPRVKAIASWLIGL